MPALRELQRDMAAGLLGASSENLLAAIVGGAASPTARLDIYRNNVISNFRRALADDYPVVARLVGSEFFNHAAGHYARTHPSVSGDVNDFGAEFAQFLSGFPGAVQLPYLADVARLEWAIHLAFYATTSPSLDVQALACVPAQAQPGIRFELGSSTRLLASDYPVLTIWQTNQPDRPGDETVDLGAGAEQLLVIRRGLEVEIDRVEPAEFALLREFERGATFADALDAALRLDAQLDVAAFLERHVAGGTFSGFTLG